MYINTRHVFVSSTSHLILVCVYVISSILMYIAIKLYTLIFININNRLANWLKRPLSKKNIIVISQDLQKRHNNLF